VPDNNCGFCPTQVNFLRQWFKPVASLLKERIRADISYGFKLHSESYYSLRGRASLLSLFHSPCGVQGEPQMVSINNIDKLALCVWDEPHLFDLWLCNTNLFHFWRLLVVLFLLHNNCSLCTSLRSHCVSTKDPLPTVCLRGLLNLNFSLSSE
jgi:hypothetical protein